MLSQTSVSILYQTDLSPPWLSVISIAFLLSLFSGKLRRHKLQLASFRDHKFTHLCTSRTYSFIRSGSGASLHLRSVGNSDCPNSEDKHLIRSVVFRAIDDNRSRLPHNVVPALLQSRRHCSIVSSRSSSSTVPCHTITRLPAHPCSGAPIHHHGSPYSKAISTTGIQPKFISLIQ